MNASIEAARSGSAGKGFAVVALEIRALSAEAQRNADAIKATLGRNEETVGQTAGLISELRDFAQRNGESAKALMEAMDEILGGVSGMDSGISEVAASIERIVAETHSSKNAVESVGGQIDLQQAGFGRILNFTRELAGRVAELREAVGEIGAATDKVSEAGKLNIEQVRKLQGG
jgi:methyl-accepting chemotaxis protein